MTDLDLDALAAVAQAATPGPWEIHLGNGWMVLADGFSEIAWDGTEQNAAHIATFDPPTVLALLAEVAALRQQVAEVEAERDEARQQVTAMEAKLPWPWSTVSIGHERVDTLTAAEQNVLSDAVHACDDDDSLDCPCEPVYAVVGRIVADLRQQVADLTAERDDLMALAVEDTGRRGEEIARAEAAEQTVAAQDRVIEQVRALADRADVEKNHFGHTGYVFTSHLRAIFAAAPTPPADIPSVVNRLKFLDDAEADLFPPTTDAEEAQS